MANIHSIQSEGSAIQLGPVTVKRTFEMKPGDKQRYLIVSDSSGESGLKIWGPAANTHLAEGQTFTLVGTGPRGGVKNQEYPVGSGKWTLNANDCRLELAGASSPQPAQASVEHVGYDTPKSQYQASTTPSGDRVPAVAKQAARGTAIYIEELVVNHGFTKDEAIMLAQGAHNMYPVYWGGEKFLS